MVRGAGWIIAVLLGVSVYTQPSNPKFEVASIKPTVPITSGPLDTLLKAVFPRFQPGGLFTAQQVTVQQLVMLAYDLKPYQVVGGPKWMREDHFQINAKAGTNASTDQMKMMIPSLLVDRFKLVTHTEQREIRYQALVLARSDGTAGPNLVPIDGCSSALVNELRKKFPEKYPFPMGAGMVSDGCVKGGVDGLANYLDNRLGVRVIDATGLKGGFYFTIRSQWPAGPSRAEVNDPDLPALPTALEEQLGLKLEWRQGPVEVLVIDSVQLPSEN